MKIACWAGLAVVLAGCSNDDLPKPPVADKPVVPTRKIDVPVPALLDRPSLYLTGEQGKVILGMPEKDALTMFPKPVGATEVREPPPILADTITASGWESKTGGFAVLAKEGSVVLAMRSIDNVSKETVIDLKASYAEAIGGRIKARDLGDDDAGFRFWLDGQTQLMIAWSRDLKKRLGVSIALGSVPVMQALRMDERFARSDLDKMRAQLAGPPK